MPLSSHQAFQAQLARDYPLPDVRLASRQELLAGRLHRSGITLPSAAAFDALVLAMARVGLYWSTPEVEAREIAMRVATVATARDRLAPGHDALGAGR